MRGLVDDMVQDNPTSRPTIDTVVERFEKIQGGLSSWKLRSRVPKKNENGIAGFFRGLGHWSRRVQFVVTRTPAIPRA